MDVFFGWLAGFANLMCSICHTLSQTSPYVANVIERCCELPQAMHDVARENWRGDVACAKTLASSLVPAKGTESGGLIVKFAKSMLNLDTAALAIAVASFAVASPTFAQATDTTANNSPPSSDCVDINADSVCDVDAGSPIIVTGSRIPRPEFEGTIPGAQVTARQIEARAFTNVLDVLNDIPLVGPGASAFGTNGGQPASLGASFVDLLDIGTNRTLTLVNGRRYVSGNAATLFVQGNTTGSQVDLNSIPTALIERIDVLTVGGAVAYGSDAIAGVVNAKLKDRYVGVQISGLTGITERGDGANYRLTAIAGTDFAGGRGNVVASIEYNRDEALTGDRRIGLATNFVAPTSFRNGAVRNSGFSPAFDLNVAGGQGAFLPAASDRVPNNIAGIGNPGGTGLYSPFGNIFQINGNISAFLPAAFQGLATTDPQDTANSSGFRPQVLINQAGNVNLVPGTPIATGNGCSVTNLTTFCNFAPTALPGTAGSATRATFSSAVLTKFAPSLAGSGTAAQRDLLALQLLQANINTPREYLAKNPGTDINAFAGTFIINYLDIANPNAATAGVLPRIAVPLQFDSAGNVINPLLATISDPLVTPSTTGGLVGGQAAFNPARYTNLRVQQDRTIANLIGHFDVTDHLTVYTENQFAKVNNISPNTLASRNSIDATTAENATLVLDIANPFLSAAAVQTLKDAGVTGKFVLSRSNQDIVDNNVAAVSSNTYRSVLGFKGDFGINGNRWLWDVSGTYGRSDANGKSFQIKDIEYALAVDAVKDGSGNVVCRAQTNPAAYLGLTPNGVAGRELVRVKQADGTYVETLLRRVVTQDQINACRPLNLIGYNQMSQASKDYVLARTGFTNKSEQFFGQATLGGSLFNLPGGPLGLGFSAEYRRDSLSYVPDALSNIGGTRTAALAATEGTIRNMEFSAETRIPIFGDDFHIPLFRNLDFTPGIRFVRQDGSAPGVKLLNGTNLVQNSKGKWDKIYSLAGSWRPFEMLTFRGNYTRSLRQPSVVELFLGGQPSFTAPGDPCSSGNIGGGVFPATRRANCQSAVIAAGFATDTTSAANFLNSYVPSGSSVTGTFAGSPALRPEKGKSWTVGGVFKPDRFIPGLQLSADYINVRVDDQIIPTGVGTALQLCYDSPTFPDTTSQVGVNSCGFFSRITDANSTRRFEVDNGFNSGFINLGSFRVKAINATLDYGTQLDGIFGDKAGRIELSGNAYHLISYLDSSDGRFDDSQESAGTFSRPKWEVQLKARYSNEGFYTQWTWNWQTATRVFSSGVPIAGTNDANEVQDLIANPAFALNDFTIGYEFGEAQKFTMQFTVKNVFDKLIAGPYARVYGLNQGRIDDFGRRFAILAKVKF